MGVATRRAADTEEMVSVGRKFRTASRARHRRSPEEPYSLIYATLLSATMASAETSVKLTNAFFVPDPQSFLHNREVNAVVPGAEFGSQVQAMLNKDLAESDGITLEQ